MYFCSDNSDGETAYAGRTPEAAYKAYQEDDGSQPVDMLHFWEAVAVEVEMRIAIVTKAQKK
jgi:hypothetical protein